MEPLAKLLVSFLDLAEAELKVLKNGLVRLGLSLAMILGAAIFGIAGLWWLIKAAYTLLVNLTESEATALAISGVLALAAAGILGVMAFSSTKTKTPLKADTTAPTPPIEGNPNDPAALRIAS